MKERPQDEFNLRLEALTEALRGLKKPEQLKAFLTDLCTPNELVALADRWEVAQRVSQGQPYREIQEQTQVSTATVTRVSRSLKFGDGYKQALRSFKGERRG